MTPLNIAAVVLNFRTPDDTVLAVRSLLASRRPLNRIIVVDNDEQENVSRALGPLNARLTYLLTGSNLGFSGGVNVGIRNALDHGADAVLLVNSDVIVPPDCLGRMEPVLAQAGIGIIGPAVLSRGDPGWIASLGMSYSPLTGRMRHRGVGRRLAANEKVASGAVDGVSGCLMLIARDVFDAIGFFHEPYFFSFEDLDFCLAAKRAGYLTYLAGDAFGYHEGGRSIGRAAPVRLHFSARNHLLLAERMDGTDPFLRALFRTCSIVMLNLAHALRARGGSVFSRIAAVLGGTRSYFVGRMGPVPAPARTSHERAMPLKPIL